MWWLLILAAVVEPLDHVRVERSLDQEPGAPVLARHLLEDADELLADAPALVLGFGHAGERAQETILGLHVHERDAEVPAERLLDLFGLSFTEQPRVDEHARELLADGLVHEEAATAESTPPDSAQSTSASPTWARTESNALDHASPASIPEAGRNRRRGTAS